MLETGQPLHAFDRAKLTGPIGVRRARAGGDAHDPRRRRPRPCDPDDLVVTDDTGAIALAGVMGGASTEIGDGHHRRRARGGALGPGARSRAPSAGTSCPARRPSGSSAASTRRSPAVALRALRRAARRARRRDGGRRATPWSGRASRPAPIAAARGAARPTVAGMPIPRDRRRRPPRGGRLHGSRTRATCCRCTPPTWRPDLLVAGRPRRGGRAARRLRARCRPCCRRAPAGRGLTAAAARCAARSRARSPRPGSSRCSPTRSSPPTVHDALRAGRRRPAPRRRLRLVNPLSEDEPELRTSLLPGLLADRCCATSAAATATSRCSRPGWCSCAATGRPAGRRCPASTAGRATSELAALDAVLPAQPRHLAAVLSGDVVADAAGGARAGRRRGPTRSRRRASSPARRAPTSTVRAARPRAVAPGPVRRAARSTATVVGHAGELHPRSSRRSGLPERTCAMELDLDALPVPRTGVGAVVSTLPAGAARRRAGVDADVPAAAVERSLRGRARAAARERAAVRRLRRRRGWARA